MAGHQEGQDLVADVPVAELLPRLGMRLLEHDAEQVLLVDRRRARRSAISSSSIESM